MILNKLIGVGCIFMGFVFVVWFPDSPEHQPPQWGWMFVLFGIFLIFFGIYLIKV